MFSIESLAYILPILLGAALFPKRSHAWECLPPKFFTALPFPLMVVESGTGRIAAANAEAERVLGIRAPYPSLAECCRNRNDLAESFAGGMRADVAWSRPDGTELPIHLTGIVCEDAGDGMFLVYASQERKTIQNSLLEAANTAALLLFSDDRDLAGVVERALKAVGEAAGAEMAGVWRNHPDSGGGLLCTQIFSWASDAGGDRLPSGTVSHAEAFGTSSVADLEAGRSVDPFTRAPEEPCRVYAEEHGLKSVLLVPVIFRSAFWGVVSMATRRTAPNWGQGEESALSSVGMFIAGTFQRRGMQEALQASEERFRDVAEATGELVWELDAQGCFSYLSERVQSLSGFAPEEVFGRRWEDYAVDAEGEEITGRMFQTAVSSGSFRAMEHRARDKAGQTLWLRSSAKLLVGPEGIAGLRGTSVDVTHEIKTSQNLTDTLKALEKANQALESSAENALALARKAEEANRVKSEFLANVSHELRTPLNAILGMAYLARKTHLDAKQSEYISKIHRAGEALLGVVDEVLDFSKIEAGSLEMEKKPFNLEKVFEDLSLFLSPRLEEGGPALFLSIDRNVPLNLLGDPHRLGQILGNLADNAFKFTEQGGVDIRCSLEKRENGTAHLLFTVRDTGIGIAPEQHERLFQSFSQGDASITRKFGGIGLGLVIVKNLLELAGGTLDLQSAVGAGTTVSVRMPFAENTELPAVPEENILADLRVLAVEERDTARDMLRDMLEGFGCRVSVHPSLERALIALAGADASKDPFNIVVMPRSAATDEDGLSRLRTEVHLGLKPAAVVVTPFGADEAKYKSGTPLPAATLASPLFSPAVFRALSDAAAGGQSDASEPEEAEAGHPYFPGARVLVAEDNPINQQIAAELLREVGITVELADNGKAAVEKLESVEDGFFKLVFMDLQMPEMDGFTATRLIRENPRFSGLPVVAMTAHAADEERERCLEAGMSGHISKPIDVAALHAALRRHLKALPAAGTAEAAKTSEAAETLPDLPELNTEAALRRLGGDKKLYSGMLRRFIQSHAAAPEEVEAALTAGDRELLLRLVHTYKGLGASLGADSLAASGEKLERTLGTGNAPESMISAFTAELKGLVGMLQKAFPSGPQSDRPAEASVDMRALAQALHRLNALLEDNDAESCLLFKELAPALERVDAAAAAAAAKALTTFEFDEARAVLEPLEKGLAGAGA